MKSYRKELSIETPHRRDYINITRQVEHCLAESGIKEGLILINSMHITSSVFINDDESGLHNDFEVWLEKLAPEKPHSQYRHNGFEDNADAHMKRQLMGREVVVVAAASLQGSVDKEQVIHADSIGKEGAGLLSRPRDGAPAWRRLPVLQP